MTSPSEFITAFEIMYGKTIDFTMRGMLFPFPFLLLLRNNFNYSISGLVGISHIEYEKRTQPIYSGFLSSTYNTVLSNGFGIPIEIELRENITDVVGFVISFEANFNKVKNFTALDFKLYLGLLNSTD